MFSSKAWRGLPLAAGAWLAASAASAAPLPGFVMPLGRAAQPPRGFVEFCIREPGECGADRAQVAAKFRRFASRAPSRSSEAAVAAPSALREAAAPALPLLTSGVERVLVTTQVRFTSVKTGAPSAPAAPLVLSAQLWAALKIINARVNETIVSRADQETYGVADFWTTPLENGRQSGDCEDYVLEKRRALLETGVDPQALNIALATTSWGETHAVLLVATNQGDYVLDNLSPWIRRWDRTDYVWLERQVDGDPFRWVQIKDKPAKPSIRFAAANG